MEWSRHEVRGKAAYWRAVWIWLAATAAWCWIYLYPSGISISGKVLITAGLGLSVFFLFRPNDAARYFSGTIALFGILWSMPLACTVLDPNMEADGWLGIVTLVLCVLVWHPMMISMEVSAYLKAIKRRAPEKSDAPEASDAGKTNS